MSRFFKKAVKFIHPGARQFLKDNKGGSEGTDYLAQQRQAQGELDTEMANYGKIPENLRTAYTAAAKRAGTYSGSGQFEQGLGSEVQAGARGARYAAAARINALRKQLGNSEEFKPEDSQSTSGNETQDQLAGAAPAPEDTSALSPNPPQEQSPEEQNNAAQSVQNAPTPQPMSGNNFGNTNMSAQLQAQMKAYQAALAKRA